MVYYFGRLKNKMISDDRPHTLIGKKSVDNHQLSDNDNSFADLSLENIPNKGIKEEDEDVVESAVEHLSSKIHFLTIEESGEILYYSDGVYIKGGETLIESLTEERFEYELSNGTVNEIIGHIKRKTYKKRQELDKDINIINLKNGLYDINKNELKPHSPHYYSINQKNIFYDPTLKPKLFGKFLSQVLYPNDTRTAIEVMAYTFLRDYPLEHFFKLHGYGANGKSVFTGLLTRLHGTKNVSNVSLLSLVDNRFALSDLEFKDINIDTELSNAIIKDTSILKKLTGGRKQPIRIERKYRDAYDTYLYAKLFFNANTITDTTDQTTAFYRRQIIISFPNTFEGKDDDPNLLDKLTTEEEISGIFNVCMHALRTLLKNKGIYLNEKTVEERRLKHEMVVNPVKSFVDNVIEKESVVTDYIVKTDMYNAYKIFCRKHSLAPKSREALGRELKKMHIEDGREGTGERRTCWLGVRLKPEYRPITYEQQSVTSYI